MIRVIAMAAGLLTLASAAAQAAEPFEGKWAQTRRECRDVDGPNSRTFIDLANKEAGKAAPLFDQYEHHCRIEKISRSGVSAKLSLRCHEFWDDYTANKDARRETATLASLGKDRLRIDGKTYLRCR